MWRMVAKLISYFLIALGCRDLESCVDIMSKTSISQIKSSESTEVPNGHAGDAVDLGGRVERMRAGHGLL